MLLHLGSELIWTIALIQVTALIIACARQSIRVLKEMDREDQDHELLRLPSESPWQQELMGPFSSGPKEDSPFEP
jgi:hypothetical protein